MITTMHCSLKLNYLSNTLIYCHLIYNNGFNQYLGEISDKIWIFFVSKIEIREKIILFTPNRHSDKK